MRKSDEIKHSKLNWYNFIKQDIKKGRTRATQTYEKFEFVRATVKIGKKTLFNRDISLSYEGISKLYYYNKNIVFYYIDIKKGKLTIYSYDIERRKLSQELIEINNMGDFYNVYRDSLQAFVNFEPDPKDIVSSYQKELKSQKKYLI
jgi:hypothetical protein